MGSLSGQGSARGTPVRHGAGREHRDVRAISREADNFLPAGRPLCRAAVVEVGTDVATCRSNDRALHDGTAEQLTSSCRVNWGNYARGAVMLPGALLPLLDPEINNAEDSKMANIVGRFTAARYWAGGFVQPNPGDIVGYFGATRLYNESYWYTHTGLDTSMPEGTPITAAAHGRVILAETLPIRGSYVLIDHGWGVYSGYAHLTQRLVVPGQWVQQGDVLGLSGNTGRSTGPHLHWEVAVGGVWVERSILELGLTVE